MNPQFQPNATQGAPAQQAPQSAPMAELPEESGMGQVADAGFDQHVQNVILTRIQTLNPEEQMILDEAITPMTVPVFVKILPELEPLFDMIGKTGGTEQRITAGGMEENENPILYDTPGGASRGLVG